MVRFYPKQKQCSPNRQALGDGGVGAGVMGGHTGAIPGATVSGGPYTVTLNL